MLSTGGLLLHPAAPLLSDCPSAPFPLSYGWARMSNPGDRRMFEQGLTAGGWTFFFLAGSVTATAFGFNLSSLLSKAMARIMGIVKQRRYNCLEIQHVKIRSLFGISWLSLSVHPRHIQKGNTLQAS